MRNNLWTKSLAVTAVSGAVLIGGAGMASADTWDTTQSSADETVTEVSDNQLVDGGDLWLGDILNGGVDLGDVASDNNVLNGVDADVSGILNGILSGNNVDTDVDPDVDPDVDTDVDTDVDAENSVDRTTDNGEDNEGLLGLL
jgi:hypothetical protein